MTPMPKLRAHYEKIKGMADLVAVNERVALRAPEFEPLFVLQQIPWNGSRLKESLHDGAWWFGALL